MRRLTPRSIINMRCTLRRVVRTIAELRPAVPLWQLSVEGFLHWVNRQREQDYSVQSINKDLSHVRGLLEYA